mgnify:CR=1 FL=1
MVLLHLIVVLSLQARLAMVLPCCVLVCAWRAVYALRCFRCLRDCSKTLLTAFQTPSRIQVAALITYAARLARAVLVLAGRAIDACCLPCAALVLACGAVGACLLPRVVLVLACLAFLAAALHLPQLIAVVASWTVRAVKCTSGLKPNAMLALGAVYATCLFCLILVLTVGTGCA